MAEAKASASATATVVVVRRVQSEPDDNSSFWACYKLVATVLFIAAVVAIIGTILGVYAFYLMTVLPILYAAHSCYKAKKRGRFTKVFWF